jgi:diguanylate cyclase (GGDEF)-like protein
MKKQSKARDILILSVLTIVSIVILLALESDLFTTRPSGHFNQLTSGWSVKYGDNEYEDVILSDFDLTDSRKGDTISFTRNIPPTGLKSPAIMFRSRFCVVDVYKDGELIYNYGLPEYNNGQYVEKAYNIVSLGDCRTEHKITISFLITEDFVVKNFSPIQFGTKKELITYFFQSHRLSMFVGGFFFVYAFILAVLGLYLFLCGKVDTSVYISAMLSLLLGTYTFTYNDVLCFVSDKDRLFSDLEYISMYLMPLAVLILLHVTHPKIARNIQKSLAIVNISLPAIFSICHYTGLINFTHFVTLFHLILIIENVMILPALVRDLGREYRRHKESDVFVGFSADNYLLLGYILLLIFMFLEIVKFNISRNNMNARASVYSKINMLDLGLLGFMICLFVYYFLSSIEHMNASRVKEELEGLAFTDPLTGLMNRAKCTQYSYSVSKPYAVIILDLDRLKKVNDTYGHLEGDKMIKTFADLLKNAFVDADLIGRTGGDEFMVVYENPKEGVCKKSIGYLQLLVNEYNEKNAENEKFTLSFSAGYAYSNEIEEDGFKFAYYLADSRMYKMKETHHA